MTPDEILRLLILAAQAAGAAREAYDKLRAVAASGGVTDGQLAEADAIFRGIRPDPLGVIGEPV